LQTIEQCCPALCPVIVTALHQRCVRELLQNCAESLYLAQ